VIETKPGAVSGIRTLRERTPDAARRERKTPVVILYAKGKPGGLVIVHQDDLTAFVASLTPEQRRRLADLLIGQSEGGAS
jgi:hypothetical protein